MRIPKEAISNKEQLFVTTNNRTLALGITVNRDVYWELVSRKQIKPIVAHKWCTELDIPEDEWMSIFKTYAGLKDTKLKAFQFKILYNLVPCNLYLNRIGRSPVNTCPSCNKLDDLEHYLIECSETKPIWLRLLRWWRSFTEQQIVISDRDLMIGLAPRTTKLFKEEQLELIIQTTKWIIYVNKQLGQLPNFHQVLGGIKQTIQIQKIIAVRNGKGETYDEEWGDIENLLT
jgi:hypothetical protein